MIQANAKDKLPIKEKEYKSQFKHSEMKNIGKVHFKKCGKRDSCIAPL